MRRVQIVVVLVLGACLFTSAQAASAADGVIPDPGSPAGKEYAIPLDQARGDNGGTNGDQGAGSAPGSAGQSGGPGSPPFGAGVAPDRSTGGGSRGSGGSGSGAGGRNERDVARGGSGSSTSASRRTEVLSGLDKGLFTIGGAVLVLALGSAAAVAAGFAGRRRRAS